MPYAGSGYDPCHQGYHDYKIIRNSVFNMFRKLSISIFFMCISLTALSQDVDSFRAEFEKFRNQAFKTYSDFRDECNSRYCEFLKSAWEEYNAFKPMESPFKEEDRPPVIYKEEEDEGKRQSVPYAEVIPPPVPEPRPEPVSPIESRPLEHLTDFAFSFYNTEVKVRLPKERISLDSCQGEDIAEVWEILSDDAYDAVISDCLALRDKLALCDWAYLQMIWQLSSMCLGADSDEAVVMAAYIYSQSGYSMRLAEAEGRLCLLYGSEHKIYLRPYYVLDGNKYYPYNSDATHLNVCDFTFENEKGLSLQVTAEQSFAMSAGEPRHLQAERYSTAVDVAVNSNLVEFYNSYPASEINDNFMTGWAIYANAPLDKNIREQVYPVLNRILDGKTEREAVDILLDFVQTAFAYEYDEEIWGKERFFFAEESLYYPYCDCEDRSILFSRLVRDLLSLDVVLVYYPGHLATAVKFNQHVEGDHVDLDGERFVICDPTYIGAPVGLTMPDMDNGEATILLLR